MKPCMEYAMEYISGYPKTEYQLKIRLLEKWYDEKTIEKTITTLKRKRYIDDKSFAESYLYSEVVNKWKPLDNVYNNLLQKWVDKNVIDDIVFEMKKELEKWVKKGIQKEIEKYKQKGENWFDIMRKLTNKWYKLDDIKKVL